MTAVIVCPHYLFLNSVQGKSAPDIEEEVFTPLLKILEKCLRHNINVYYSLDTMEHIDNNFPWNLSNDIQWKGFIRDWYTYIVTHLSKYGYILDGPIKHRGYKRCLNLDLTVDSLFENELNRFLDKKNAAGIIVKGVVARSACKSKLSCNDFMVVLTPDDLRMVKYPWLRVIDKRLPVNGDHPFIPPVDWSKYKAPKRGNNNGYLDNSNQEWIWDKLHKDHWDLQINGGKSHINVLTNGKKR